MPNHFQTDLTTLKAELDAVDATSGSCANGVDPADIDIVATSLGEGITKQREAVKDRENWITPRDKTYSAEMITIRFNYITPISFSIICFSHYAHLPISRINDLLSDPLRPSATSSTLLRSGSRMS